ncbi:MAG: DegV family protein [Bacilli bacterium]
MNKVKILTDTCSDLTGDLLKEYDIDYCHMNTVFHGRQQPASLTWEYFTEHEFYETMRNNERYLMTQVSVEEFTKVFTKYLDQGMDIVYIGCSTKQSGSVNTATTLSKELIAKYPNQKIFCIDALRASIGEGMLAMKAADEAKESKDSETIYKDIMSVRNNLNQFITVGSLTWLQKAGRVKSSAAFFGNLLGVKPILIADCDGAQTPIKKVKGRPNSVKEIVMMLKNVILDADKQTVWICEGDCKKEEIDSLIQMIKTEINPKDVKVVPVGPIIGASCGPDTLGVWAFGKTVTYSFENKTK